MDVNINSDIIETHMNLALLSRLKGQKKLAFSPSSLILANNVLPLNEALSIPNLIQPVELAILLMSLFWLLVTL